MNHYDYLIKEATNIQKLMATARSHNIPLEGDWRYAARLLSRQATPAGKKHFNKVVGFATPGEEHLLSKLLRGSSSKKKLLKLHTLAESQPSVLKSLRAKPSDFPNPLFEKIKYREMGIFKSPNTVRHSAPGIPGMTLFPSQLGDGDNPIRFPLQKSIHTHPITTDREIQRMFAPAPHRSGVLGNVFPSSAADTPILKPEIQRQYSEKVRKSEYPGVEQLLQQTRPRNKEDYITIPQQLTPAIDALKKLLASKSIGHTADLSLINYPTQSTHSIIQPETGAQSVFKGRQGLLNRMYFKHGKPLV